MDFPFYPIEKDPSRDTMEKGRGVTPLFYPGIHEVIQAMTGCPIPTIKETVPCPTDSCIRSQASIDYPDSRSDYCKCVGYVGGEFSSRPGEPKSWRGYYVCRPSGALVPVVIAWVSDSVITVRTPEALQGYTDTTRRFHEFNRMTGLDDYGNHIAEMYLSRLEANCETINKDTPFSEFRT